MKLKDLLETDLEADIPSLKADKAKEGELATNVDAVFYIELTNLEDSEPTELNIHLVYDEIDEEEINIIKFDQIRNRDIAILLSKLMKKVTTKSQLSNGGWITVYDKDYGLN